MKAKKKFWRKPDLILQLLIVAGVFCLIFSLAHTAVSDPDIWLHLKSGEVILQTKAIPRADIFSFTNNGKPWTDHEWLFQFFSYIIYSQLGANGLILLQAVIIALSFWVLFLAARRVFHSYLVPSLLILLSAQASIYRFNIRPDIFSLLFFAIFIYFLRFKVHSKAVWLLIPIQILWVNIHGYFFLGPLLVFLFIASEFIRRNGKILPSGWKTEFALNDAAYTGIKKLFLLLVFSSFLNPQGIQGAFYPTYIFTDIILGRTQLVFDYIQELKPTFEVVRYLGHPYSIIAILCALLMAANFKRLKIIDILMFAFFFVFSLKIRNIAFFAFAGFFIIISYLPQALSRVVQSIQIQIPFKKQVYFLTKIVLEIALIIFLWTKINSYLLGNYYDFDSHELKSSLLEIRNDYYPKKAADFILEKNIPANTLNDFNSGAYLIGRFFPEKRVFIDGRTEFYGADFFGKYLKLMDGNPSVLDETVKTYDINSILISMRNDTPPDIVGHIFKSPQWKLVFFDETGIVFLKNTSENQGLIKQYGINLNKYIVPEAGLEKILLKRIYPFGYIRRGSLFLAFGEYDLAIGELQEALRIKSNCYKCRAFLGRAYMKKQLYNEALENLRAAILQSGGDSKDYTNLGICLSHLGENAQAITALKKAVKINKKNAFAHYNLGLVYLEENKLDAAATFFEESIKYAPDKAEYHSGLAEALYRQFQDSKDEKLLIKVKEELGKALTLCGDNKNLRKEIEDKIKPIGK